MRAVHERFGGQVPRTMDELLTLRGVARKTANVVLGTAFGINEGVVVDTHVMRLAQRFGLTRATKPEPIERDLMADGFVMRYDTRSGKDGLPPGEGAFLACSFWFADNLLLLGRAREARRLFKRLIALCNDVGLLAEEYDPSAKRLVGNFPQALSHIALVNTAHNLLQAGGPARQRADREEPPRSGDGSAPAGPASIDRD